jgi:hypothetical protein
LTAKYILYSYLLPENAKKIHYKADGAGCFASNVSKAAMLAWKEMTGKQEISYRISVAGDGKTKLDTLYHATFPVNNIAKNVKYDYVNGNVLIKTSEGKYIIYNETYKKGH